MSFSSVVLPLCAVLAAMALPVQAAINAQLARGLGNPVAAVAVSFGAGLVLLVLLVLTVFRDLPPASEIVRIPPWLFFAGGSLGVLYLIGNVVLVPRLGAAAMFSFAIAGQLIASGNPAAVAAGLRVVGLCAGSHVRDGHGDRLRAAGADVICHSFAEVRQLLGHEA